jgi:hypothetical protein
VPEAFPFSSEKKFRYVLARIMRDNLKNALSEFVRFTETLRGDEKSEAQSFLDHFFPALGHAVFASNLRDFEKGI